MPEQDYKIIYGNQEYELTCRSSSQFSNNFYIIGKNFGSETGFDYPFQFYVPSYTSSKTLYVTIYGDIPEPKVLKIEGISWKKNIQIKKSQMNVSTSIKAIGMKMTLMKNHI